MPGLKFKVGDVLHLKTTGAGNKTESQGWTVTAVLPDSVGMAQYHVRFGERGHVRRITEADINLGASPPGIAVKADKPVERGSWINSNAIRTKK